MDAGQRLRFSRTRGRPGYAVGQVDAFLERVEATLGLRHRSGPVVTAAEVSRVQFRLVRLRAGYDMREVDEALDRYEEQLRELGRP